MAATLTIPTIFTAVDKFSGVIGKMNGSLDKFSSKAEITAMQFQRRMSGISSNARSIAQSTGIAGLAIAAPLMYGVHAAMSFEKSMSNVSTLVDTNKESMSKMGDQVLSIYRQFPVALDDLTKGLYQIRSAGIPAADAMDVLKNSSMLSVAGLSSVTESANVLTSAINVFKGSGQSAKQMAGSLFETVKLGKTTMSGLAEAFGSMAPITHSAGVSLQDFLSATAAITVAGPSAAQAMNEIRATVNAFNKPNTTMEKIFQGLGVKSASQLITKFGNLGNAIQAVQDKGTKMGLNLAKAWGRINASNAATLLTGASKAGYQSNLLQMTNGVNDYMAAYAKQQATAAAKMQLFRNNMQAFAIEVGTVLLPVLTKIVGRITPIIESVGHWMKMHPGLTKGIVETAAGIAALLLVISPLALGVGLVADGLKLASMLGMTFASTTATVAAAVATETPAMVGFGAGLSTVTTEFGLAETAAAGFFATLSAFVLPAALVTLAGLALYKVFEGHQEVQDHSHALLKKTFFNRGSGLGMMSPFNNPAEESAYQSWWLQQAKSGNDRNTLNRSIFDLKFGSKYNHPILDTSNGPILPALNRPPAYSLGQAGGTGQPNTLDITLHDPAGLVKDVKQKGGLRPKVTVTPTSGVR